MFRTPAVRQLPFCGSPSLIRAGLLALAAVAAFVATPTRAAAQIVIFNEAMTGAQQVPPNASPATGSGCLILNQATHTLRYAIGFEGLTAPETAAHIHGFAPAGANAGILFPLPLGNPKVGSVTTTAAQEANLIAGLAYVNIHTTAFPGGEIRGQVLVGTAIPVLVFEGLPHTALGNADICAAGPQLLVTNIGASGQDGVRVALGEVQGWGFNIDEDTTSLPVGAYKQWTMRGLINGAVDQPAWTERHQVVATPTGNAIEVSLDTSPLGATQNWLEVYHQGAQVFAGSFPNGALYRFVAMSPSPPPFRLAAQWDATCVVRPIDPNNWPLQTASGAVVTTYDTIVTYAANATLHPTHYSAVESRAANLPWERLDGERVVVHGHPHAAIGGALLNAAGGNLTVTPAAVAPTGGVAIGLGRANSCAVTFAPIDPGNAAPVGSMLLCEARGRLNGVDDRSLGELSITKTANGSGHDYRVDVDFNNIASPTHRVQVVQGGAVVLDLPGQTGSVGQLSSWPRKNGKLGGGLECFTSCPPAGGTILIGGTVYAYEELRVLAEGPGGIEWKTSFDVRATANLAFTLVDELVVPYLIATATPQGPGCGGLLLSAMAPPVQGSAAVPFQVRTANIPPTALVHFGIIGLGRPGIPLAVLGLPTCFLNASADVLDATFLPPPTPPFLTWTPLVLPAIPPSFIGFEFNVQAMILGTPLNNAFGFGALTSNGLKCVVGSL